MPASDADVQSLERRLGIQLPRSYRDFLLAAGESGWYASSEGFDQMIRGRRSTVYPISHVDKLAVSDPKALTDWLSQWEGFRRKSDSSYYRYGHSSGQNELEFNGEQLHKMIKVGGYDRGHLILLNPAERAADGELEAWVAAPWHGVTRYPSFGALIQEIAYRDILDQGGYLLSQTQLSSAPCLSNLSFRQADR